MDLAPLYATVGDDRPCPICGRTYCMGGCGPWLCRCGDVALPRDMYCPRCRRRADQERVAALLRWREERAQKGLPNR
jgi:hypothetical protein